MLEQPQTAQCVSSGIRRRRGLSRFRSGAGPGSQDGNVLTETLQLKCPLGARRGQGPSGTSSHHSAFLRSQRDAHRPPAPGTVCTRPGKACGGGGRARSRQRFSSAWSLIRVRHPLLGDGRHTCCLWSPRSGQHRLGLLPLRLSLPCPRLRKRSDEHVCMCVHRRVCWSEWG